MKEGERKMEAVMEEFVIKQEQEYDAQCSPEGDSCSTNEQEEEGEEEEKDSGDGKLPCVWLLVFE